MRSHAAFEGDAFGVMLVFSALHDPVGGTQVSTELTGDRIVGVAGFGFSPIKGHAKRGATSAAALARVKTSVFRSHN